MRPFRRLEWAVAAVVKAIVSKIRIQSYRCGESCEYRNENAVGRIGMGILTFSTITGFKFSFFSKLASLDREHEISPIHGILLSK